MKKLILLFTLFIVGITYGQNLPIGAISFKGATTTKRNTLSTTGKYPVLWNTTLGKFQKWNGSAYEDWEVNDLSVGVTWANIPDANITESSVTQHEAALTITGANITNLSITSADLSNTGVAAAAYTVPNITVDAAGRVTSISSGLVDVPDLQSISGVLANEVLTTNGSGQQDYQTIGSVHITDGAIDETDLDVSTNASLDLADSSIQTADINTFTEINTIVADVDLVNASSFTTPNLLKYARFSGENTLEGLTGAAVFTDIITTGSIGATQLASTAVTPGSYTATNLTVDADGRITAASNGSGGGGDDVSGFAEKAGDLVGTDRLVGLSGATDFNETISGIPLSIFNDDLTHTAASTDDQTAVEVPVTDAGALTAQTEVEGYLAENRTAINLNTSKVTNATHTGEVTGATVLTIASEVVDSDNILNGSIGEADLDIVNTPTDEYVLTYEAGTSNYEWQASGATPEDAAYAVGWDADLDSASKNAIYDEMETRVDSDVTGVTGADVVDNVISLTQAEYDAIGTPDADTFYIITDAKVTKYISIPFTTQGGDVVTGTSLNSQPYPVAITITDVWATVLVAGTTSVITVDINEDDGTPATILSTKITIDATERSSSTAAIPPVISDTAFAAFSHFLIDVDTADSGNTGTTGTVIIAYTED